MTSLALSYLECYHLFALCFFIVVSQSAPLRLAVLHAPFASCLSPVQPSLQMQVSDVAGLAEERVVLGYYWISQPCLSRAWHWRLCFPTEKELCCHGPGYNRVCHIDIAHCISLAPIVSVGAGHTTMRCHTIWRYQLVGNTHCILPVPQEHTIIIQSWHTSLEFESIAETQGKSVCLIMATFQLAVQQHSLEKAKILFFFTACISVNVIPVVRLKHCHSLVNN